MRPSARRRPLQELPLELFLLPETPMSPPKSRLGLKRPHSPNTPSLYSPTKKRILTEEGIFCPEITMKSPASTMRGSGRLAHSHFHGLLQGSKSPARKLDFGAINPPLSMSAPLLALADVPMDISPVKKSTSAPSISMLAPSPELVEKKPRRSESTRDKSSSASPLTSARSTADDGMDIWFSPIRPSRSTASPLQLQPLVPLHISREVAPPDRGSTHYPGFEIHQDALMEVCSTGSRAMAAAATPAQPEGGTKDADKENVAPRKKSRKASEGLGEGAWVKAGLPSPAGKAKAAPATRSGKCIYHLPMIREGSVTPKKRVSLAPLNTPGSAGSMMAISPAKTPVGKEVRLARKRAMKAEVELMSASDDELDMDL